MRLLARLGTARLDTSAPFMKFLSLIPFVLCNRWFMDADQGGGAGGSDNPPPPSTDPDAPPPEAPKPAGETVENKLASAGGLIGKLYGQLKNVWGKLQTANASNTKLQGQFDVATKGWDKEKEDHNATKGLLGTANTTINGLTKERDDATTNVTRLEKLCGLHGVPISAAAPVPANNLQPDETSPAGKWAKYQGLKKQEAEGTVPPNTAMNYWRENQKDLDKHAASKR